jgi:hypothetical protein
VKRSYRKKKRISVEPMLLIKKAVSLEKLHRTKKHLLDFNCEVRSLVSLINEHGNDNVIAPDDNYLKEAE